MNTPADSAFAESYARLIDGNRHWVAEQNARDPHFFEKLAAGQKPEYLWIGCSDSRVPANEICGLGPGEVFVQRNVANLVVHTDLNLISVLHYAVDVLNVKHVIVCGHYGCGGVLAAMGNDDVGIVNKWLRNIKEVYVKHREELDAIATHEQRADRLVELNVMDQVANLAKTSIVQRCWAERALQIHGLVYSLKDGLLRDLHCMMNGLDDLDPLFRYNL